MRDWLPFLSSPVLSAIGWLIVLAFFLPWVTVSCSSYDLMGGSGYDLMVGFDEDNLGNDLQSLYSLNEMTATDDAAISSDFFDDTDSPFRRDALLVLMPMVGVIIGLVAGLYAYNKQPVEPMMVALAIVLPVVLAMGLLGSKWVQMQDYVDQQNSQASADMTAADAAQLDAIGLDSSLLKLRLRGGWWLTWGGLVAALGVGGWSLRQWGNLLRRLESPAPPPEPSLGAILGQEPY